LELEGLALVLALDVLLDRLLVHESFRAIGTKKTTLTLAGVSTMPRQGKQVLVGFPAFRTLVLDFPAWHRLPLYVKMVKVQLEGVCNREGKKVVD
jgi:hypothetical protein